MNTCKVKIPNRKYEIATPISMAPRVESIAAMTGEKVEPEYSYRPRLLYDLIPRSTLCQLAIAVQI